MVSFFLIVINTGYSFLFIKMNLLFNIQTFYKRFFVIFTTMNLNEITYGTCNINVIKY